MANRFKEESKEYLRQVNRCLKELEDKSDSETFDDEKERILGMKAKVELESLKEKVRVMDQMDNNSATDY